MNRRRFLQALAVAPVVAALPALPEPIVTGFVPVSEYAGIGPILCDSIPSGMALMMGERMRLVREMVAYGAIKGAA